MDVLLGIDDAVVDYEGNCGNMSSGVGIFAIMRGMVPPVEPVTVVRIYNTNTDKVIEALDKDLYDAVVLNYANCDMVGHTGVVEASIKAVEAVDACVGRVYEKVKALGGVCLITADHGNAEKLIAEDGSPFTAHTTNLVPVVVTKEGIKLHDGALCDIAPTLLQLLGIEQPKEMTGKSLID